MPKKKRSPRSKSVPIRVRLLIVLLVLVVTVGVVAVKYLQTPRGSVLLLDIGFSDHFGQVQNSVDLELRATLRRLGLDADLKESSRALAVGGEKKVLWEWNVSCDRSRSLIRVNLALTQAVARASGIVRLSKETLPGEALLFEVGSRKYPTHRITVVRRPRPTGEASEREAKSKIALVIDDLGYSKNGIVEAFLDCDFPLTLSVIPTLPYSKHCLKRIAEEQKEAILHLPMEAEEFVSDVPPVLTTMSDAEIDSLVERYIRGTPGVIGVNNHLGSIATQDPRVMAIVLEVVKARGLFFLDSLTSSKSIAYNTAKSLGVPTARNDVFIDADTEEKEVVEARLERLLEIAVTRGYAIGIGHPMPWTLEAIRAYGNKIKETDVELVFVSALVE